MRSKMKKSYLFCILAMVVLLSTALRVPAQVVDLPSDIHDLGEKEVTWDSCTFPGFYYDMDSDIGTETLTFRLSDIDQHFASAVLSDQMDVNGSRGAVYTTKAFPVCFSFGPWGEYQEIGFLGGEYFAAYDSNITADMDATSQSVPFLYDKSGIKNLIANGELSEILLDDDSEQRFNSSNPLELYEGYNLSIKSVDPDRTKVNVELSKNGQVVDSKVIRPSKKDADIGDETYYYKKDLGSVKDIVIIAIHFKDLFGDASNNIATVDGEFQISDMPISIVAGERYDRMSVRSVDPTEMTIVMDNKDNPITLSRNRDIALMDDICIRTADQDETSAENPLRYYLYYKEF